MELDNNPAANKYQILENSKSQEFRQAYGDGEEDDKQLKQAVSKFSSVFLNQMFKSMRSTLSDDKLIDGGFSEDVFTGMMDREISEKGSEQGTFNSLNQILFQQLDQD